MSLENSNDDLTHHPAKFPIMLKNANCIYCGVHFCQQIKKTKEHVIGRRFVPKGTLSGQWNLIVNACVVCNSAKADLEDDISAITMAPNSIGQFAVDDERLHREAARKAASSISRRTRKPIDQSKEEIKISIPLGPMRMKFDFVTSPQVDEERIYKLAHMHFCAFFYFITFDKEMALGRFVDGSTVPLFWARKENWGAPELKWFTDLTGSWLKRVYGVGADGYFKVIIRRQSEESRVWSWALEWNQSTRVVGFAGNDVEVDAVLRNAPEIQMKSIHEGDNHWVRFREEFPLESDDILFDGVF